MYQVYLFGFPELNHLGLMIHHNNSSTGGRRNALLNSVPRHKQLCWSICTLQAEHVNQHTRNNVQYYVFVLLGPLQNKASRPGGPVSALPYTTVPVTKISVDPGIRMPPWWDCEFVWQKHAQKQSIWALVISGRACGARRRNSTRVGDGRKDWGCPSPLKWKGASRRRIGGKQKLSTWTLIWTTVKCSRREKANNKKQ